MFGPGMEQLDDSLVTRLMHAPDVLPVSGIPHRQIIGEITLMLSGDKLLLVLSHHNNMVTTT